MSWSSKALECVKNLNNTIGAAQAYIPFIANGIQCGMILKENLAPFRDASSLFILSDNSVTLSPTLASPQERSTSLNQFFVDLRDRNIFSQTLKGWRNETYSVYKGGFNSELLFDVERAAVPILGCKSYGVHVNGYSYIDGELKMWVGKRSHQKPKYPGCYDNIVAGGISTSYGIQKTLIKEADEEANIPAELIEKAVPVGALSYTITNEYGTSPEVEYVYDIELPPDFTPSNNDGEVAGFELMSIEKLKEVVVGDKFKHNCAGVAIDFLLRHGLVDPDQTPEYVQMLNILHSPHLF